MNPMKPANQPFIYLMIVSLPVLTFFLSSCQIETKRESEKAAPTLVDGKYSLAEDRSELDKIRESIPEAKRKANDEKALLAEWMSGFRLSPMEIQEKQENLVRKKRELFNKDMTRLREEISKSDKKKRDEFLKDLEKQRMDFSKVKKDREERAEFYNQLDDKRRSFFSDEREKKDEFESNVREKRKNFEDYLKEKSLDFNSELKVYSEKWTKLKKNNG